jgi:hypothetical protein
MNRDIAEFEDEAWLELSLEIEINFCSRSNLMSQRLSCCNQVLSTMWPRSSLNSKAVFLGIPNLNFSVSQSWLMIPIFGLVTLREHWSWESRAQSSVENGEMFCPSEWTSQAVVLPCLSVWAEKPIFHEQTRNWSRPPWNERQPTYLVTSDWRVWTQLWSRLLQALFACSGQSHVRNRGVSSL